MDQLVRIGLNLQQQRSRKSENVSLKAILEAASTSTHPSFHQGAHFDEGDNNADAVIRNEAVTFNNFQRGY